MPLSDYEPWRERLARYQVQTLVTTVGSNPLPALVVSRLLVAEGGTVVLCGTPEVQSALAKLETLLKADGFQTSSLRVAAHDPAGIFQNLATLRGLVAPVGLDYTGGTKAMAVFANEALAAAEVRRCYLDARHLRLQIVEGRLAEGAPTAQPFVGDAAVVSGRELLGLHRRRPAAEAPLIPAAALLPDLAGRLAEDLKDAGAASEWRRFATEREGRVCLHSCFHYKQDRRDRYEAWLDTPRPGCTPRNWPQPTEGPLSDFLVALHEKTGVQLAGPYDPAPLTAALGWPEGAISEWLHGKWLEHHVADQLAALDPRLALRLGPLGLKTWFRDRRHKSEFEIDVLALRGYQLHAFSCTTSRDKKTCKQKLFEARLRATQLGGDEARVCLVCASDESAVIRGEVAATMGDDRLVSVCGATDLPRFGQWYAEQIANDWPPEDQR